MGEVAGIVRRAVVSTLVLAVVGTLVGWAVIRARPREYRVTTELYVSTPTVATGRIVLLPHVTYARDAAQSLIAFAASSDVVRPVARRLHVDPDRLAGEISADAPVNKTLIDLHVTDRDPVQATRAANLLASRFEQVVPDATKPADGVPGITVATVSPAVVPAGPDNKPWAAGVGIGLGLGAAAGLLLGLAREARRQHSEAVPS